MKTRNYLRALKFVVGMVTLCALTTSAQATVLIDEQFASGYNRTNNDINGGNMAVYKGRTNTSGTINVGSLSFSTSGSAGASGYWSYFTDQGSNIASVGSASSVTAGHLALGVGDKVTVSIGFSLGTVPADTTTYALRFALFDTANGSPVRKLSDATAGPSNAAFTNNPAFAAFLPLTSGTSLTDQISLRRRTTLTSSNPLSSSGDWTQMGALVGGAYTPLTALTNYTFNFSVARLDASTWEISSSIIDTLSQAVMTSGSVQTNSGLSSFNWFQWRAPQEAVGAPDVFTEMKVEVIGIPEPSTLALVGAGLGMMITVIRRRRR